MSNMSYCRFENTVSDLRDCEDALEGLLNADSDPLSERELAKAKELVRLCSSIALQFANHLIENGESLESIDDLEALFDSPRRGSALDKAMDELNENAEKAQEEEEEEENERARPDRALRGAGREGERRAEGRAVKLLSRTARLRAAGFDLSEPIPFERSWRVRCSQCEALVVNGVPCHERGCPNEPREEEPEDFQ